MTTPPACSIFRRGRPSPLSLPKPAPFWAKGKQDCFASSIWRISPPLWRCKRRIWPGGAAMVSSCSDGRRRPNRAAARSCRETSVVTTNLPNYFLADLPAEAELTPGLITEACQTLQRNSQQYLEGRTTDGMIRLLDRLGRDWQSDEFPFRQMALQACPAGTGFSAEVLAAGLDQFFQQWTAENFESLLRQELGHAQRLDDFFHKEDEGPSTRASMAVG